LQHELTLLQTQHFELNLKHKKIIEDNRTLQTQLDIFEKERKDLFEKYNSYNDDMQKSENERLEIQEKNSMLKKKIKELKEMNNEIEEELKNEKKNSLATKISYSKVISKMQEDMKLIKTEWEKKCKSEANDYERLISDLEAKHNIEINNLKQDFQFELENKNRELSKYKQSSDLLKNFEKEFVRLDKHEELLSSTISDLKKKHNLELMARQEELENDLKKTLQKLGEDKKTEYEFITNNARKMYEGNIKSLNLQIQGNESNIQELKTLLKARNEAINDYNNTINDLKTQLQSTKTQLDRGVNEFKSQFQSIKIQLDHKNEELVNVKKEYEYMRNSKIEWEKKCKTEANDFEKTISELEAKHVAYINILKQELQTELENKTRELSKYKQNSDLVKMYENEYIKIEKHEEVMKLSISELKKKHSQELLTREEQIENDFKKRLQKITEEKWLNANS
jgi:chromosome segregation ATPase